MPAADRAAPYMEAATAWELAALDCLMIEAAADPGTRGGVYREVSPPLTWGDDPCPCGR
jgi:hypothetical protein